MDGCGVVRVGRGAQVRVLALATVGAFMTHAADMVRTWTWHGMMGMVLHREGPGQRRGLVAASSFLSRRQRRRCFRDADAVAGVLPFFAMSGLPHEHRLVNTQAAVLVMVAALAAIIFTIFVLLLCKDVLAADHERPIVQGACVHVGTVTD